MNRAITPSRERALRRSLRESHAAMDRAALEFLDACKALRAARRAQSAAPSLNFRVGLALAGGNVGATNRAWRERFTVPLERDLHRAHDRVDSALGAVHESRAWYRQRRRQVRAIDSGEQPVEIGAAWSPRGLANVRAANRRVG
jgi:hypothetical protein